MHSSAFLAVRLHRTMQGIPALHLHPKACILICGAWIEEMKQVHVFVWLFVSSFFSERRLWIYALCCLKFRKYLSNYKSNQIFLS